MKTIVAVVVVVALGVGVAPAPVEGDDAAERLGQFMQQAAEQGFRGSVLVARKGQVLLHAAYGTADARSGAPLAPDSVFTVGSITKQFTAAGILKLREAGKLELSDPITKFFREVPEDKRAITLHHLLTHQAGFPGAIGDDRERVGRDDYVRRALDLELLFEPGTRYEYSNVGYSLAAAVLEFAAGRGYELFLREQLFLPAGMRSTGYHLPAWKPEQLARGFTEDGGDWGTVVEHALSQGGPGWNLLGNGGIHSTASDMLRWHRALAGPTVLSDASKKLLYTPHADEGGGTSYGYGWSLRESPWGRVAEHNGGNRVYFADYVRFLDRDVVIYYATTSRDRRMARLAEPLAEIVFTDGLPELPPAPGPLVRVDAGPPAPAGSPAARWGLPGSQHGQRAGELLDAVVETDAAKRRAFIESSFEPALIERNGVDRLLHVLDDLREKTGTREVRGLSLRGENGAAVIIETGRHPAPLQLVLQLEPEPPHRITRIEVQVGD